MFDTKKEEQRAILLAVDTGEFDSDASIAELEELANTAGAEVICTVTQNLKSKNNATYVGQGKLLEVANLCKIHEIDLVICDDELSGVQIRNLEEAFCVPVVDRTMLILDIFALRALTNEGKLQVELAQQKYRLPRLIGLGQSLSKQQGGIGSRGAGESQLETDRRHIKRRIDALSAEIEELSKRRERTRERRNKSEIPTIAIVGYTNVGKSTLLNYLTQADVLVKDMLFATLDPTARELKLPNGKNALLIDTVGLLRRLPHQLVNAFRSTLEEASSADLILHLCDISSENVQTQIEVTNALLADLKCGDIKMLTIYNKIDKLDTQAVPMSDKAVAISAKTGQGIDNMLLRIAKELDDGIKQLSLLIPYEKGELLDLLRKNGKLLSESYENDGVKILANVEQKHIHLVEEYIV